MLPDGGLPFGTVGADLLRPATPAWPELPWPAPLVMGVLNVTPDSFSDGGAHADPVTTGLAMLAAGADLIDVGGESTRPRSVAVSPNEEQARVLPVVAALAAAGAMVSIDTRNASTMRLALAAGAAVVNDVSGLRHDRQAAEVVAGAGCRVVLMHMRGEPSDMHRFADYDDVAGEVVAELGQRVAAAVAAGIARARIAVDPGIGFAKTAAHNIALLSRLGELRALGCPVVLGVSRKGFIGSLAHEPDPARRAAGSIAAALFAWPHADILRVHDVAETVQAVRVWRGLSGFRSHEASSRSPP